MKKIIKIALIALSLISTSSFSMTQVATMLLKKKNACGLKTTAFGKDFGHNTLDLKKLMMLQSINKNISKTNSNIRQSNRGNVYDSDDSIDHKDFGPNVPDLKKLMLLRPINKNISRINTIIRQSNRGKAYYSIDHHSYETPAHETLQNHDYITHTTPHDYTIHHNDDLFPHNDNPTTQQDPDNLNVNNHGTLSKGSGEWPAAGDADIFYQLPVMKYAFINGATVDAQEACIKKKFKEFLHNLNIIELSYEGLVTTHKDLKAKLSDLQWKGMYLSGNNIVSQIISPQGNSAEILRIMSNLSETDQLLCYQQAYDIQVLDVERAVCELSLQHCNELMAKCDDAISKAMPAYAEKTKNMSMDDLTQHEIPGLISKIDNPQEHLNDRQEYLKEAISKLATIQKQIKAFSGDWLERSIAKGWGFLNTENSKRDLESLEVLYKRHIEKVKLDIENYTVGNVVHNAQLDYAQNAADAFKKQEDQLKSNLWQEIGVSSDACTRIHGADVKLATFENLPAAAQKEVLDLLNQAGDQKTGGNSEHEIVITETIKLADLACQAHSKGNSEYGSYLVAWGHTFIDCAKVYAKGAIQGVGNNIQHKFDHPMQALGELATCVVVAAALPLAPVTSAVILGASVAVAVVDIAQKVGNLPLIQAVQKAGEISGDFAADCLIINYTIKATSAVTKIVVSEAAEIMKVAKQELTAMGKFTKAEIDAFIKAEKLVARSVEGLEMTFNAKKAQLAQAEKLHLEMKPLGGAKNPVKSGFDGARILADAHKIITKDLTAMAEKLGFSKTNIQSQGEAVFKKGNRYITFDKKGHNGGIWKMADSVKNLGSKHTRMGTYNEFLKKIGD